VTQRSDQIADRIIGELMTKMEDLILQNREGTEERKAKRRIS
jgi:hypothetical protein